MSELPGKLTIEQEFILTAVGKQIKNASAEQLQDIVVEMHRQMMVKDNLVKHLLKNK